MAELGLADWLARLERLHPAEIDMGLDRVAEVATRLQVLDPAPLVFTVTGTNGKGSTCAALDSLLRHAGRRSGCYSSPHLIAYNERVSIDGQPVSDADLCAAFAAIDQARGDISLTYFEFGTLAALWLFKRAGLDAVVLEVGLGGRLDAVNVIDAHVAVVTSIGLDHSDYLGDSRDSVGYEKAGILRHGRPLVCSETDLPPRFLEQVRLLDVSTLQRGRDYGWTDGSDGHWRLFGLDAAQTRRDISVAPVRLPRDNLSSAVQAFWAAGLDMPDEQIAAALVAAFVPGRLDRRSLQWGGRARELLLDVGHNPQAAGFLAAHLAAAPARQHAVFGLLADKDLDGILQPLRGQFGSWAVAPLPTPRSRDAQSLAAQLDEAGERTGIFTTIGEAIAWQLDHSAADEKIVVFGSFFCVAEAILWLNKQSGGDR
ncbi:bifunctional tetrahydrofolate synthase/dihydrofolate synthase [Pseudomonas sp. G11-1]|uniref:bifunctional tetrahydrofolate synthase/dihydrofolate synthase n=1 Tax=Halopseudomonas sp. SMJS2 TaxID=3041098 RepID=UPI0024530931|nr:bifunctional tetrahydrofolate synthase/dihydrofolate synthase [Halopseudomonas sp. SMJS2]MCO5787461.1 bifunctional tetrahydrofolate synthase/dihydrofolate synthase [Pseudomonas sp. G11-1]MCO5790808.1 bifunctional tetrahydrofolate synthase/dihydrofolate synthase [Pseudomonas sp. G11-2]WGK60274.1 bifunctional tetrahydrofolate synthase/dihydrofolate synthase [Halopseudomonas sp. SMJS2]